MATDLSLNQHALVAVEDEGLIANYGVDPTIVVANDGILTLNSPNPDQSELNFQNFNAHSENFDSGTDTPTHGAVPINFRFGLMGGTAVDVPPRFNDVLRCCALHEDITVTTGPVVYTPATRAQQRSSRFSINVDGWTQDAAGAYGNLIFRLSPEGGPIVEFQGLGLIQDPVAGNFSGWSGGTNAVTDFGLTGADRLSINNGGTDYFPIVNSVEINLNRAVDRVIDANSGATGNLNCIAQTPQNPTCTLRINFSTDAAANVAWLDFVQDRAAKTLHAVNFGYTDAQATPRKLSWAMPSNQIIGLRKIEIGRYRGLEIRYKVTGAWTFTQT